MHPCQKHHDEEVSEELLKALYNYSEDQQKPEFLKRQQELQEEAQRMVSSAEGCWTTIMTMTMTMTTMMMMMMVIMMMVI
eukprot:8886641-Karenia_brevis.AAC.1